MLLCTLKREMLYPDNSIKGIPNNDFIVKADGSVGSHFFHWKPEHARDDGWTEQSINWQDDESVVEFTLSQTKDNGELQFKAGVAIVPRSEIDRLSNLPSVQRLISYERQEYEWNPYHGNILLSSKVPKQTMRKIAASLALSVSAVIRRDEE